MSVPAAGRNAYSQALALPGARSGILLSCMFFAGGCLIAAPYSLSLEEGSLSLAGIAGAVVLAIASLLGSRRTTRVSNDLLTLLVAILILWTIICFVAAGADGIDMRPGIISNLKTYYLLSFIVIGLLLAGSCDDAFSIFLQGVKWINVVAVLVIWYQFYKQGVFATGDLWAGRIMTRDTGTSATAMPAVQVLCLGLSLCDFIHYRSWPRRLVELALMGAFAFSILLSLNRSSWLMAIAFMLLVLWIGRFGKPGARTFGRWARLLIAFLLVSVIIGLAIHSQKNVETALVNRVFYYRGFAEEGVLDDRQLFWPVVVDLIRARPIFGYGGISSFYISTVNNPHSEYFDTLIRYGVLGCVLLNAILVLHASRASRLARMLLPGPSQYRYILILAPFALSTFVFGLTQYSVRDNVLGALTFMMVGYVLALWRRRRVLRIASRIRT